MAWIRPDLTLLREADADPDISMPSRLTVVKPDRENVTTYAPGQKIRQSVLSGAVADDGSGFFNEHGTQRLDPDAGKNRCGRVASQGSKKRKDLPGSLKRDQVVDLVAFIPNFDKYSLGQKDLPTEFEALKAITITSPQ